MVFYAWVRALLVAAVAIGAHAGGWDLPGGKLLKSALDACQVEHFLNGDDAAEQMLCPIRLPERSFPRVLRDAVIASEDADFFGHGPIDYAASARAALRSLRGHRQGGSTITQQLARTLFLKKEDTFERKLREAVLAVRIAAILSKPEILTRYMNVVPHARNMYGFDAPARFYFGVGVEDLDLAEAALLAGMLPEPNNRDPLKDPGPALASAHVVLAKMSAQGKITADQAADAEEELRHRIASRHLRRGTASYVRPDYRSYRDLARREAKANGIALPAEYRLFLFIDPEFQEELAGEICSLTGQHQAAGIFMRPSGEVLAVSGSCVYTGEWNRAADIERSIGSTGKLFPLIGVHEASFSLKERIATGPVRQPNWPAEPNARCRASRTVSLDFALEQSCNRPWTEVALRLGEKLTRIVKRFDLDAPSPALVPIGGLHTSPMRLARAYASLENGGRLPQVRFLLAAIGAKGNVLGLPARRPEPEAMSPETAAAVLRDLRGPVKRGTARAANSLHALVYGKTGTSSSNMDALFVGLTQDFVGTLWVGYDKPAPMPGVYGGGAPAKAFGKLTDVYYLRLARERLLESRTPPAPSLARQWVAGLNVVEKLSVLVGTFAFFAFAVALLNTTQPERRLKAGAALPAPPLLLPAPQATAPEAELAETPLPSAET
ncbi:transglycosylase domain-containing protein [Methyloceanibacter sp.]|uniref:transglycosylase domain-containing protein n=1 Tax=Methyloceanibacter sp. TaxID=1965321 RepID=UPI002D30C561|nr:transglycosylase domain-containing protein [Methyloceanibacter sp.]HZP08123.1 transglycosylase domain-containing protein [Methyloceanibacter sp.]